MSLTEAQKRHLSATLRTVESWLADADEIIHRPYQGIALRIAPELDAEQRTAFLAEIEAVRSRIAHVATTFGVPCTEQSEVQALRALLSTIWQALEESRPVRMRGYGRIDDTIAPVLEAEISALIAEVERLRSILGPRGSSPR